MLFLYLNDIDGKMYTVQKPENTSTLTTLQTLVEGLIECVCPNGGIDLWVNEEGLFREDFQINRKATMLAELGYPILGPAVIATSDDGETFGAPKQFTDHGEHNDGRPFTPDELVALRKSQLERTFV